MDGRPAAGTPQTAQAHGGWQHGSPPQPLKPAGPPAHPPTHPPSLPLWPGLHWGFPAGPMHPQLPIRPMMMMPPMGLPPPPQGRTGPSSGFEPPAYFPSPIANDGHAIASPSFLHSAPAPVVQQGLPRDPWGVGSQEEPESSAAAPAAAVPAAAQSGRAAAAAPGQPAAAGPAAGIEAVAAAGLEGQGRLRLQPQYEVGRTDPAELHSQDMLYARDAAQHRLQQLYPRLPPLVRAWLMHRLIAWLTLVDKEARVRIKSNIVLPLASAVAACDTLALASTHDVVEQTASLLEDLRHRFMAGEDLRDTVARHLVIDIGTKRHSKYVAQVATAKVAGAETLEAQVMQLVLDPSLAALNTNPANGGAQQAQALPPPQQPAPTRGALSQPPEPLRQLFLGGDGGKLLEQLLRHALTKDALPVAAALAPWRPDEATVCQQQQQQLPLSVSPDVDFGTVCVASLDAEALQASAASVAAGLPRGGGRAQAASAGSVLDLLHLSAAAGGAGGSGLRHLGGASGSSNASTGAAMQPVSTAAPVLHYRQIVVDNKSEAAAGPPGATDIWLLGGMAAPSFPHTFTVLDDACLFWLDGHQAVRLAPKQQHTITVALSSADCAARQQESGIMQQLLLLIFAVPLGSAASQALAAIHGVAMTDVFGAAAGAGGGPVLAAQAGLQAAGALAGSYRLFAVVRRVTVALIDRPADLAAQLLDVDAKPFISDRLRRLFDDWPSASCLSAVPAAVEQLLETGDFHESYAQVELPPSASQKGLGLAAALDTALSGLLEAPLLLRYSRLLVLEEEAMERDICRYDAWHVRLRLAVFAGSTSRYHLLSLTPHGTGSGTADQRRGTSVYRGPAVELLQPGGVAGVGAAPSSAPLYVLAVLDVPGLPEGRPGLLTGDAVYLRTAHQPQREIVALVAATEGSSCFLLMPLQFWQLCDVAPLVPMLRTAEGSCGGPGLLDGLVHVRFGFNRVALRSMQHAVAIAAGKQQDPHTCWVPSLLTPFQPRAAGMRSREQEVGDQALRARLKLLQPQADEVAATAAALAERGKQKLNAEQRHTVAAVLCGAGRAFPFALNGPPGTGKTVTLVECALQIMQAYPHARLLLCAPQNYSADLMCSAMAAGGIKQGQMLRLNDPRRPVFTVKDDVLPFCCFSEHTRMFSLPAEVSTPRVIVATCGAAGMLLQEPHTADPVSFTHVLIDEAGQALLPEALIPLSLLMPASSAGQVGVAAAGVAAAEHKGWGAVLCGDPRQLGPVVRSHAAAAAGLTTSLLEVCIGHHSACAYEVMRMGRVPPTAMLVRNYRSHARLLELPSKLFYKSSLQAAADPQSVLPPRWQELQVEAGSHGWQGGRASAGKLPHTAHQTAGGTTSDQHAAVLGAFGQSQQPAISAEEAKAGKTAEHDAPTTPAEEDEEEEVALGPADAEVAGAAPWEGQQGEQNLEEEEREEDAEVENWDEKAGQDADYDEEEDDDDEDEEEEEEEDHVTEEDTGASLLFYGVRGQQMREGDAPSYFNPLEASSVVSLVSGLLGSGAGVQPDDIGVMATYRKQVQKIRLLLRQRGLGSIRVGTVDDYQGQEERIIFISTTLSKPESLPSVATAPQPPSVPMSGAAFAASDAHESGGQEAGADRNLGFWRNPKRFNVAITRAKALLVVVGHPAVLLEDSSWRELLRYCFSNGAYRGAGSDSLRQRFRVDVGAAAGALPDLPAGDEGAPAEADDWELQRAINQLAELALLGGGHADQLFPDSLDEMYAAALDEAPFRVVL